MIRTRFLLTLMWLALFATTSLAESLYVTEGNGNIYSYQAGQSPSTATVFYNTGGQSLSGIVFDSLGNAYVSYSVSGKIEKITPSGQASTFATIGGGAYPLGLTFDSSGNLYAVDGNNNTVDKISPTGQVSTFITLPFTYSPYALAFDGSGNLFVSVANGVNEYDSSGHFLQNLNDNGAIDSSNGLVFDSKGNLYIANAFDSNIYEYSSTGQYSIFASTGLSLIQGLAIDSLGNIYVANENAGNTGGSIAEYSSTGALIASGTGATTSGAFFLAIPAPQSVPEPSTLILLATGLAGALAFTTRRINTPR